MNMVDWLARVRLCRLMEQFPAVLVLGARQSGKTTLVRQALTGSYLDLEKPSDLQMLDADIELGLRNLPGPVTLDEAHVLPQLFPVLRSLIDEDRHRTGQFVLLGSVNPALVRGISESMAGRIGVLDLSPFVFPEVAGLAGASLSRHWVAGGFPDAYLAKDSTQWGEWQEAYLRTFVERDLPRCGLKASAMEMRRFMTMLAHLHGGLLNASELGRAMGLNYHTIQKYLDVVEGHYLVRKLPPWFGNIGKRLAKSPKVYIRDCGVLHHLLGIASEQELLVSPKRGFSFEGAMIEQIIVIEQLRDCGTAFSFFRTSGGAEIDLVVKQSDKSVGYEFKSALSVRPSDASGLKAGLDAGVIDSGRIVYLGNRQFPLSSDIDAVGASQLLAELSSGL